MGRVNAYVKAQTKWAKENNIVPGETEVLVVTTCESGTAGWNSAWNHFMRVGEVHTVWGLERTGVRLTNGWSYPFFVLSKVEEK